MATAMILGKPGSGGGAGGFCLNYDATTPLRSIDMGGPDQEQRYATQPLFEPINLSSFLKDWRILLQNPLRIQATI